MSVHFSSIQTRGSLGTPRSFTRKYLTFTEMEKQQSDHINIDTFFVNAELATWPELSGKEDWEKSRTFLHDTSQQLDFFFETAGMFRIGRTSAHLLEILVKHRRVRRNNSVQPQVQSRTRMRSLIVDIMPR